MKSDDCRGGGLYPVRGVALESNGDLERELSGAGDLARDMSTLGDFAREMSALGDLDRKLSSLANLEWLALERLLWLDGLGLVGLELILVGLDMRGLILGPSLVLVGMVVRIGERPIAVGADWRGFVGEPDRVLWKPGRVTG
jgi:hypothetical protein